MRASSYYRYSLIKFRALSACMDLINVGFASTDPVSLSSSACMPATVRIFWTALILMLCSDLQAALYPALRGACALVLQSGTQGGNPSTLLALPIPAAPKIQRIGFGKKVSSGFVIYLLNCLGVVRNQRGVVSIFTNST